MKAAEPYKEMLVSESLIIKLNCRWLQPTDHESNCALYRKLVSKSLNASLNCRWLQPTEVEKLQKISEPSLFLIVNRYQ
jgi:hypothetical protein